MGFLPGFRFRKQIGVTRGVKVNVSKSRVSTSLGGKGATINVGADGRRMVTLGIPGTGMSYRTPLTGPVMLILVGIAALIFIAWLVQPELVRTALHWWQPAWF
ncbi:MAG TPA: DUF4236 domain-containing protein [Hyphomicrobium sp.]|nr:DUF4236 domain-containing protein [Hyphomicrobium sp.]